MATIKHISSKNADYGAAEKYLTFAHDEFSMKPALDSMGQLIPREDYRMETVNCNGEDFALSCIRANLRYGKNSRREDVKSHHYIISFGPRDRTDNGLTVDKAQALGLSYCKEHFPGHQAIVCTHPDGHNHSGNIHVHIVINSLRISEVERKPYMDRNCDTMAGAKHRCTAVAFRYLRGEVMEMCHQAGLYQIDLLCGSKNRVTEREYWAKKQGQRQLDKVNAAIAKQGLPPKQTKFETDKDKLRQSIWAALSTSGSFEDFKKALMQNYGIEIKESRGRYSYLTTDRTKHITARKLGDDFDKNAALAIFAENAARAAEQTAPIPTYPASIKDRLQRGKAIQSAPKQDGVGYILTKQEYMGHTVLGKTVTVNYKGKKRRKAEAEELMIFKNTHEAIIDEETWELAHRLRKTIRKPSYPDRPANPLTGLVYCADCGHKLTHRQPSPNKTKVYDADDAYVCGNYRQLTRDCTMHFIKTSALRDLILSAIREISTFVRSDEKEFLHLVREETNAGIEVAAKEQKKQLHKAEKRIAELDGLIKKLYEGNATGKIPDKHFNRMLAEYDKEQSSLEQEFSALQQAISTQKQDYENPQRFIALVKRHTDFTELTTPMLNEFIEKVIVHEATGDRAHHSGLYSHLLLSEKLYPHLLEVDQAANERMAQLMPQMVKAAGIAEQLKATNQMQWVGLMNAVKAQVEEIIFAEFVYDY